MISRRRKQSSAATETRVVIFYKPGPYGFWSTVPTTFGVTSVDRASIEVNRRGRQRDRSLDVERLSRCSCGP